MEVPDVGLALNNEGLNTVSRGARLGCFIYEIVSLKVVVNLVWLLVMLVKLQFRISMMLYQSSMCIQEIVSQLLFSSTEMPVDEIQTLLIAAVSKVNEEHILYGTYEQGELERVQQAISLYRI